MQEPSGPTGGGSPQATSLPGAASYSKILKSTSIVGGSAAVGMLISMISVKGGALLLGPAGIGELRLYQSVLGTAVTLLGFGFGPATVRRVAHARSLGRNEEADRALAVLHRLSLLTGCAGWLLLAIASFPVSILVFDDRSHVFGLAIAGSSVVFTSIAAGYASTFQAEQRVATIAKTRISASFLTALLSIACFWMWGAAGIVPSLVVSAASAALVARLASGARSAADPALRPTVSECIREGRSMAGLGLAMMAPSILGCIVGAVTGSLIVRQLDIGANGLLSAAMGMSVLFASFILNAMESDFFPRLSAVRDDPTAMRRLVNEQTEVGILLALPGLVGTIALAPAVLTIFYTSEFAAAAALLIWQVLGVFGRITAWPASLVLLARGDSRIYLVNEVAFALLQIALVALGINHFGLVGAAIAYFVITWLYNVVMLVILNKKLGLKWTASVVRLVAASWMLVGCLLALRMLLPEPLHLAAGMLVLLIAGMLSARGLIVRLGPRHRLVQPLLRWRVIAPFRDSPL
jgi:antigen flippase